MKNAGIYRKTNPYLSKTAQFPQVAGVAGRTALFFGTFFWASKESTDARENGLDQDLNPI